MSWRKYIIALFFCIKLFTEMLEEIPKHITTPAEALSLFHSYNESSVIRNGTALTLWGDPSVGNLWFPSDPLKIENIGSILHRCKAEIKRKEADQHCATFK